MDQVFPKKLAVVLAALLIVHQTRAAELLLSSDNQTSKNGSSAPDDREQDKDDEAYAIEETKRRLENLEQLIGNECTTPEDVSNILEALEEYMSAQAYLDKNVEMVWRSETVQRGYLLAAQGITHMLIPKPDHEPQGTELTTLLEGPVKTLREHLLRCPNGVLRTKIEQEFEPSAVAALRSIRMKRMEQATKAVVILRRALPESPMIAISSILSVYAGALESARLYLRGEVLNRAIALAIGTADTSKSKKPISIANLVLLEFMAALVNVLKERAQTIGKRKFVQNLKTDLFSSLVAQDMEFFEKNDLWEVRHLIGNAKYVCTGLLNTPTTTLESFTRVVSSLILLFKQSPSLSTFIFLVALPLKYVINTHLDDIANRWERARSTLFIPNKSFADVWQTLVEPRALKTMRAFAREPKEVVDFARSVRAMDLQEESSALIYQFVSPVRDALDKLLDVFGAWYGSKLVGENQMRAADLPSFVNLCSDTFDRGRFLYASLDAFGMDVLDPVEKMHDLLTAKPKIGLHVPGYDANPALQFSIEFHNVRFAYPTRPQAEILRGVSFKIEQGERIGVMGESGCGKSTIFSLLERFYEPTSGQVLVGGVKIEEINPLFLRERIAYVTQQSYMAKRTVKENLLYGRRRRNVAIPSNEQQENRDIERALSLAQCSFFLTDKERFPQGLLTDIGSNASKLSGGEVQRLSLARALLSEPKPRMLLLDEYTSALDETSQKKVQEAINAIWEESGRTITILSIAHRISNFKHVDRVICLSHEGRVAEIGVPRDLLFSHPDGIFATFVKTSEVDFTEPEKL